MDAKSEVQDKLMEIFKTVMDSQRLKIIGGLVQGSKTNRDLIEMTGLSQPKLQRHLTSLVQSGLVEETRSGEGVVYSLDLDNLQQGIQKYFSQHSGQKRKYQLPDVILEEDHALVRNVIKPDGRLKYIPSIKKKKQLETVLDYISTAFETGTTYSEREVNDILLRFYSDFATLRRYLVDYQLLGRVRDGSKYWREADNTARER